MIQLDKRRFIKAKKLEFLGGYYISLLYRVHYRNCIGLRRYRFIDAACVYLEDLNNLDLDEIVERLETERRNRRHKNKMYKKELELYNKLK